MTTMPAQLKSNTQPSVLTVRELAGYLRIHQATVYRLLREQKLPAFRVGADWRFNRKEIERWMIQEQNRSYLPPIPIVSSPNTHRSCARASILGPHAAHGNPALARKRRIGQVYRGIRRNRTRAMHMRDLRRAATVY